MAFINMETHIPCAALQPYIKVFHIIESQKRITPLGFLYHYFAAVYIY